MRVDHPHQLIMNELAIPVTERSNVNRLRMIVEYTRTILWLHMHRTMLPSNAGLDIRSLHYALEQQLREIAGDTVDHEDEQDSVKLLSWLAEAVQIGRDVSCLRVRAVELPYVRGWFVLVGGVPTRKLMEVTPTAELVGLGRIATDPILSTISRQTWEGWTGPYPTDPGAHVRSLMRQAEKLATPSLPSSQQFEAFVVDRARHVAQWKSLDQVSLSKNVPSLLRTVSKPRTFLWGWGEGSVLKREAPANSAFLDGLAWIRIGLQLIGLVGPYGHFEVHRDGAELVVFPSPPTALRKQLLIFGVPIKPDFSRFFIPEGWRSVVEDCLRFFHYTVK